MPPEEDHHDLFSTSDRTGLGLLSPEVLAAREDALSPVSRFLSDIATVIHRANPVRSLPPLSVMMRRDFGLNELPSDEVGLDRLSTQIRLFVAGSGLIAPKHLNGILREAIASANGPLVPIDLSYHRV